MIFCGVQPHFVFPLTNAAEKHLTSEKPLDKRFFKDTGVIFAVDCRLRRRKRDRNVAAVEENPRSKLRFSSGTARVSSAVRKFLISEQTASPTKSVSPFSTRLKNGFLFKGSRSFLNLSLYFKVLLRYFLL